MAFLLMFVISVELIRSALVEMSHLPTCAPPPCANPSARPLLLRFNTPPPHFQPGMTIITDPLFYLLAVPAVTVLGLAKGGFSGIGMVSTPLLALTMPPLQAAAILLPIILCQDAIRSGSTGATGSAGI